MNLLGLDPAVSEHTVHRINDDLIEVPVLVAIGVGPFRLIDVRLIKLAVNTSDLIREQAQEPE